MQKVWLKQYDTGVPETVKIPNIPLCHFLEVSARKVPDQTALVFFDRSISFRDLNAMANQFAAGLYSLGFKKGDRVALLLPNCPQMVAAYYGILKARGVVVQINPLLSGEEIAFQIRDAAPKVLVSLPRFEAIAGQLLAQGLIQHLVQTGVGEYASFFYRMTIPWVERLHGIAAGTFHGPGRHSFKALLQGRSGHDPEAQPHSHDIALIQYTSGTTGRFKGAILTHANLVGNVIQCRAWMRDLRPGFGGDIFLGVLPFFHVYGMTVCMNLAISQGCTQVIFPRFVIAQVLAAVRKYRCTIFPGVEPMYNALNRLGKKAHRSLNSIRACISGAGPLYRRVQEEFESITGGRVVEGYGLTEASPVTHSNPLFGKGKSGSIGVPLPGTEARIMDSTRGTRVLPPGHIGELVVRGPQVMQGYWRNPAETKKALRRGWLYTGDLATMDRHGYFRILERKKDMIKTRGENVYPRTIEESLLHHPGVADVVVVGLPDRQYGEKIKAYIVTKGTPPSREELTAWCARSLAKFEVPQEFEFRTKLPKNIIGKTLRRLLREEEKRKKKEDNI